MSQLITERDIRRALMDLFRFLEDEADFESAADAADALVQVESIVQSYQDWLNTSPDHFEAIAVLLRIKSAVDLANFAVTSPDSEAFAQALSDLLGQAQAVLPQAEVIRSQIVDVRDEVRDALDTGQNKFSEVRIIDGQLRFEWPDGSKYTVPGKVVGPAFTPNVSVATLADRAIYDDEPRIAPDGSVFAVLVNDTQELFVKESDASGDWSDGFKIGGPPGETLTDLTYDEATGLVEVVTSAGFTYELGPVKGDDGRGIANALKESGELILVMDDGEEISTGIVDGADGADGADGVDGGDGLNVYSGDTDPDDTFGVDGELFVVLEGDRVRFLRKEDGTWVQKAQITTPQPDAPPDVIEGVTAVGGEDATGDPERITVSWTVADDPDVAGYRVYFSEVSGGPYSLRTTINNPNFNTFNDNDLGSEVTRYYVVTAFNSFNVESDFSAEVFATTDDIIPPDPPQNVSASGGDEVVVLQWDVGQESDLDRYWIYRSETDGFTPSASNLIIDVSASSGNSTQSYTDTGRTNGVRYYYRIKAVDEAGNISDPSAQVDAMARDDVPPAAPTNLSATGGELEVALAWDANTEDDLLQYRVYRQNSSVWDQIATVPAGTEAYTDEDVAFGQEYTYRLRAEDTSQNLSDPSATATAQVNPDTSPLPAPQNVSATGGDEQIDLDWSAVAAASHYKIQRAPGLNAASGFVQIDKVTSTSYTDALAGEFGESFTYRLIATDEVNSRADSEPSATASATTNEQNQMDAPTGLSATGAEQEITVTWDTVSGATYRLEADRGTGFELLSADASSPYVHSDLGNEESVSYRLRAEDAVGDKAPSTWVEVSATTDPAALPTVSVLNPSEGALLEAGSTFDIDVAWSAGTNSVVAVRITYDNATQTISNPSESPVSTTTTAVLDAEVIEVEVEDSEGLKVTSTRNIVVAEPATVNITSPLPDTTYGDGASINVEASVLIGTYPVDTVKILYAGGETVMSGSGTTYAGSVSAVVGENTLTVEVTDTAGFVSTDTVTIQALDFVTIGGLSWSPDDPPFEGTTPDVTPTGIEEGGYTIEEVQLMFWNTTTPVASMAGQTPWTGTVLEELEVGTLTLGWRVKATSGDQEEYEFTIGPYSVEVQPQPDPSITLVQPEKGTVLTEGVEASLESDLTVHFGEALESVTYEIQRVADEWIVITNDPSTALTQGVEAELQSSVHVPAGETLESITYTIESVTPAPPPDPSIEITAPDPSVILTTGVEASLESDIVLPDGETLESITYTVEVL